MTEEGQGPSGRAEAGRRTGVAYGLTSLAVATAGFVGVRALGLGDGVSVAIGVYGAWIVQVVSFWRLAEVMAAGRPVLRDLRLR